MKMKSVISEGTIKDNNGKVYTIQCSLNVKPNMFGIIRYKKMIQNIIKGEIQNIGCHEIIRNSLTKLGAVDEVKQTISTKISSNLIRLIQIYKFPFEIGVCEVKFRYYYR